MIIDILYAIILVMAIVKGLRKGFIIAIFSVVALIAGLAAAMKLSTVAAGWLDESTNISSKWLPFIAFLLVFVIVVILVNIVAKLIEKSVEFALLGWLNRILGILLYAALYTVIYSIILFYAVQMNLFKEETIGSSVTYAFVEPWGPYVINALGSIIPWFRDMFEQLKDFFGGVSDKVAGLRA